MNDHDDGSGLQRCMYNQRRMVVVDDGAHTDNCMNADHLHKLLFQPIAGDSTGWLDVGFALALRGMQFGILDTESIQRLAVVHVKLPSVTESPECLGDLRMGASGGVATAHASPCQTCHMSHHNCPGHFEPEKLATDGHASPFTVHRVATSRDESLVCWTDCGHLADHVHALSPPAHFAVVHPMHVAQ